LNTHSSEDKVNWLNQVYYEASRRQSMEGVLEVKVLARFHGDFQLSSKNGADSNSGSWRQPGTSETSSRLPLTLENTGT
jgi:hypothetical protein